MQVTWADVNSKAEIFSGYGSTILKLSTTEREKNDNVTSGLPSKQFSSDVIHRRLIFREVLLKVVAASSWLATSF